MECRIWDGGRIKDATFQEYIEHLKNASKYIVRFFMWIFECFRVFFFNLKCVAINLGILIEASKSHTTYHNVTKRLLNEMTHDFKGRSTMSSTRSSRQQQTIIVSTTTITAEEREKKKRKKSIE